MTERKSITQPEAGDQDTWHQAADRSDEVVERGAESTQRSIALRLNRRPSRSLRLMTAVATHPYLPRTAFAHGLGREQVHTVRRLWAAVRRIADLADQASVMPS
jgi:hypothetical protein